MPLVPRNSDVLAGGAYQNSRPRIDRTSILGHSHTQVKIVVPVVGVVVVPFTDDAVLRVIVPATAAFDAVNASRATL